jgi:maltose alpha-D-glucosyltransferase/alpha-amylase
MTKNLPAWLKTAVFYQVYPQSYYDSNGDGIGDLPGLIQKLDYIQSLGCNALWLNPCFASPFQDAGYDISDFYKIAPRYGTNADIKRLFSEAKKRGIRVLLDLVMGHASLEHPWFKKSAEARRNPYSDWFIWTKWWNQSGHPRFRTLAGSSQRDGQYLVNFFYCQPALNYGFIDPDPEFPWQQPVTAPVPRRVLQELLNVVRFWLEMGASGFRVDCAPAMVKGNTWASMVKGQHIIWEEVNKMLIKDFPQAILLAEWFNPPEALREGFHLDFPHDNGKDFGLDHVLGRHQYAHKPYFKSQGGGDIHAFIKKVMQEAPAVKKHQGHLCYMTGNHDHPRLSRTQDRTLQEMSFAFIFTMPGVPKMYYGDEIGMRFLPGLNKEGGYPSRTGSRTPMQWSATKNAGFSTAPANRLYLPVDPDPRRPNVAGQEKDQGSLLNFVKRLVAFKKTAPGLEPGARFEPLYLKPNAYPCVYLRQTKGQTLVIALNPRNKPVQVTLSTPRLRGMISAVRKFGQGAELVPQGKKFGLKLAGKAYGIFEILPNSKRKINPEVFK